MSLLLIIGSFSPREGGAERQFRQLGGEFARRGASLTVVTQRLVGEPKRAEFEGCTVYRAGWNRVMRRYPRLGLMSFFLDGLLFAMRAERPSGVISTQFGSASVLAAVVGRLRSLPRAVRLTGGGTGKLNYSEVERRSASAVGRLLMRISLSRNAILVAPAKHLTDEASGTLGLPAERLATIPNGVAMKAGFAGSESRSGVVWYGRVGLAKNTGDFLDAAAALPNVEFVALGRVQFQDEVPSNVRSLGWISDPEAILLSAQAVLSTSLSEGSPNLCLQGIAAGAFVVGYEIKGLIELRSNYPGSVYLVSPGDSQLLAATLGRVLDENRGSSCPDAASVLSIGSAATAWLALFGSSGD
jgi:glycosyltransferase involved in cell wall biosynthesis